MVAAAAAAFTAAITEARRARRARLVARKGSRMEWRLYFSMFTTIFLAELGDKTQLTALSMTATGASRWSIIVAASLALICSTTLAVFAGEYLTAYVPLVWLRRLAGASFLVLGAMTLWQART